MLRLLALVFCLFLVTHVRAFAMTADAGTTEILRWPGGRQAALALMFDDNLPSQQANAVPLLIKHGLSATFYVNPDRNGFRTSTFWQRDLPQAGFELGVHTLNHRATEASAPADIAACVALLRPLAGTRLLSFARPGPASAWAVSPETTIALLEQHDLVSRDNKLLMYTGQTTAQLDSWIDDLIRKGEALKICFHGVDGDHHSVSMPVFTAFVERIAARKEALWSTWHLAIHVHETVQAQATASAKVTADGILVELTTRADPTLYSCLLTLRTTVPSAWASCRVTQGKRTTIVSVEHGAVQYEAQPGTVAIELREAAKP